MLSVVVPIYNVQDTLQRCVQSVLSQSFSDWELLLVDDGSPDGSGALADALAREDSRIRVFHKPNGGLSDARNYGIDRARGEYITFLDSDDDLAPDTYSSLMPAEGEDGGWDILEYNVEVHCGHESAHRLALPDRLWCNVSEYWHHTRAWDHCYAWNKIYRRSLFTPDMRFPVGKIFEDVWFFPRLLQKSPVIATTSKGLYRYRWNTRGITVGASGDDLASLLQALMEAGRKMGTTLSCPNARHFYYGMLCRQIDVYRTTQRIYLPWPFVKTICRLHRVLRTKD